jgi:hypothetical protein
VSKWGKQVVLGMFCKSARFLLKLSIQNHGQIVIKNARVFIKVLQIKGFSAVNNSRAPGKKSVLIHVISGKFIIFGLAHK